MQIAFASKYVAYTTPLTVFCVFGLYKTVCMKMTPSREHPLTYLLIKSVSSIVLNIIWQNCNYTLFVLGSC